MDPTLIYTGLTGAVVFLFGLITKMWLDRDNERKETNRELRDENKDLRAKLDNSGKSSELTAQTMARHAESLEAMTAMFKEIMPIIKELQDSDGPGKRRAPRS